MDTRDFAHTLGGEIVGNQIVCPGPNHTTKDRSLSVRLSASAPDGSIVHSHAGDDWQACRDYVRDRLGLPTANSRWLDPPRRAATHRAPIEDAAAKATGTRQALAVWRDGVNPRGTVVERYLNGRGLELGEEKYTPVADQVPLPDERGRLQLRRANDRSRRRRHRPGGTRPLAAHRRSTGPGLRPRASTAMDR
jgi:hypothetical protein